MYMGFMGSLLIVSGAIAGAAQAGDYAVEVTDQDRQRLELVKEFADNVLERGRDQWSAEDTPLFVDGLNAGTGEPVVWRYEGDEFIVSNLASQQNLFRVLVGLSNVTGDDRYRAAAEDAIRYHVDHLLSGCGLFRWGGHQFIDLATLEPVGHFDANCHEFKCNYPFYELLWEVCEEATAEFIRAFWNAHIGDWEVLDMNRHGAYGADRGALWENEFGDPEAYYEGDGLSFINCGSDLIHAGGVLYQLAGEEGALTWARRLAEMYVKARHPDTGLGAYQFSKFRPGDRAERQFAEEFGDVAREGWVMWGHRVRLIYVLDGFVQLGMAEAMGDAGADFLHWTADGLEALARYAYVSEDNSFRPMWADGTDLTGYTLPRDGYYGSEGLELTPLEADEGFLMVYARAYRLTGRDSLWETARQIAQGLGIGDIGEQPGQGAELAMDPSSVSAKEPADEIIALLELHRAAPDEAYVERARLVANSIVANRIHEGFFLPTADHVNANFNRVEPLAILTLDATLRGEPDSVPIYMGSQERDGYPIGSEGYIHGRFDGLGRTTDEEALWAVTRD